MADLATAYLRLVPSLKGAESKIKGELSGINMSSAGEKLGGGIGGGIMAGIGKLAGPLAIAGLVTQGVEMAVGAAADTFRSSFENAADFEQLAGGVETLFGETAEKAMQNAQNAFKTAGISANEYMEQVNSFAASLRQALGPERAGELADYADRAVQDMADNANKMGTDMASIQNAYQGFAKQNYTMLDNLKLGYGGTKSEMERLLADASKLAGVEFNIDSYADVVDAIHVIQENMGITGTTAEEAAHTVSGSISMLQASWTNLLTEFGKENGDIEGAVQNVVDSIGAVVENALPMVERILSSIGKAIGDFAMRAGEYFMEHKKEIFDKAGEFIKGALEAIVTAVPYIVEGIAYLIASLLEYVINHIPDMLEAAGQLMVAFARAIVEAWGPSLKAMNDIGQGILDEIGGFFVHMYEAGADLVQGLVNGILSAPQAVYDAIAGIVGNAIDGAKRMLGIHSPSKVFEGIGKNTMLGLESGIEGELARIDGIMRDVNGSLTADVSANVEGSPADGARGGLNVYVTVDARDEDDPYEIGRLIGQTTAYELRMQGVSA